MSSSSATFAPVGSAVGGGGGGGGGATVGSSSSSHYENEGEEEMLIPMLNFSMVAPGVFRSGYPNKVWACDSAEPRCKQEPNVVACCGDFF